MNGTLEELDIIRLIKRLDKLLRSDFDKRLNEHGLTGQQGRILFYLNHKVNEMNEVVHQNDIEKEFKLSKSTVSGLIKRLEKAGFVKKECTPPYHILVPTDEGVKIIEHFRIHKKHAIEKLTSGLNDKEKETLVINVRRLITNMEKEDE